MKYNRLEIIFNCSILDAASSSRKQWETAKCLKENWEYFFYFIFLWFDLIFSTLKSLNRKWECRCCVKTRFERMHEKETENRPSEFHFISLKSNLAHEHDACILCGCYFFCSSIFFCLLFGWWCENVSLLLKYTLRKLDKKKSSFEMLMGLKFSVRFWFDWFVFYFSYTLSRFTPI